MTILRILTVLPNSPLLRNKTVSYFQTVWSHGWYINTHYFQRWKCNWASWKGDTLTFLTFPWNSSGCGKNEPRKPPRTSVSTHPSPRTTDNRHGSRTVSSDGGFPAAFGDAAAVSAFFIVCFLSFGGQTVVSDRRACFLRLSRILKTVCLVSDWQTLTSLTRASTQQMNKQSGFLSRIKVYRRSPEFTRPTFSCRTPRRVPKSNEPREILNAPKHRTRVSGVPCMVLKSYFHGQGQRRGEKGLFLI